MAVVRKRSTLAIWKDVIYAILLREIKGRFNDKFGISWAVIQPVTFIVVLSFMRGRFDGDETHTMPPFVFIFYGMVSILLFLRTLTSTATTIKKNKQLFSFRQVQPISSILAVAIFELLVKIFVIIVVFIIMYFLGIEIKVHNPLALGYNLFVLWLVAISLGMLFGIGSCFALEVDRVREMFQRPLFFISGVFFTLQDMPQAVWKYFDWNPILHSIELSRQAAYPTFGAEGVSYFYLNSVTLILLCLSLATYKVFWKQAISR